MDKVTIFLLATCAFEHLIFAETVSGSDSSKAISTSADDQDNANRGGVAVADSSKYGQRPSQGLPVLVECHVCTDCAKTTEETPSKLCPLSYDPNKRGKCVTYAEKYKHMQRSWYIRGCATERGSCEDIKRAHNNHGDMVSLLFCNECEGERCNGNGASSFADFTIAFVTLIITPFVSKLTLC